MPVKSESKQPAFDRLAVLLALLVAGAIWCTWPVAEIGADDDWSYIKTSLDLARTGHLHYNGWATIMLGALAYWGAAVVKVFGFSFTALRLSVLPFAAASAWTLVRICRRSVINTPWTILLTLTTCLSPVFVFSATNFSSDIPGLLATLLCADLAATVACTPDRRMPRKVWLLITLAVIGFLGGTTRQIVWGMPIVSLLYVGWHRRREVPIVRTVILSLIVLGSAIWGCEAWFHAQPYSIPEYFWPAVSQWVSRLPSSLVPLFALASTGAMFLLPMFAGAMPALRSAIRPMRFWGPLLVALAAALPVGLVRLPAIGPWLGNIVTPNGIDRGLDAIGDNPESLPLWVCLLLSLVTFASMGTYLCGLIVAYKSKGTGSFSRNTAVPAVRAMLRNVTRALSSAATRTHGRDAHVTGGLKADLSGDSGKLVILSSTENAALSSRQVAKGPSVPRGNQRWPQLRVFFLAILAPWRLNAISTARLGTLFFYPRGSCRKSPVSPKTATYAEHIRMVLTLYAVGYVALIVLRSNTGGMFDRYLIPLLPIAGLWIARFCDGGQTRVRWPAWAVLGVFAYYSLANTHDFFAESRARISATTALEGHGIPRQAITAGMAYDAWTELGISGYVNDVRIANPPDAFRIPPADIDQRGVSFWYWTWTPSVRPRVYVVNAPQRELTPFPLGPFTYTAWLPPFDRAVYVQGRP